MAKADLLEKAQTAGLAPADATPDDYTTAELEALLTDEPVAWEGSLSATEPLIAPDGHVVLSQEDIDARS